MPKCIPKKKETTFKAIYLHCLLLLQRKKKKKLRVRATWLEFHSHSDSQKKKKRRKSESEVENITRDYRRDYHAIYFLLFFFRMVVASSSSSQMYTFLYHQRNIKGIFSLWYVHASCIPHQTPNKHKKKGRKTENMCSSFRHQKKYKAFFIVFALGLFCFSSHSIIFSRQLPSGYFLHAYLFCLWHTQK